jgi:hypothetical protein
MRSSRHAGPDQGIREPALQIRMACAQAGYTFEDDGARDVLRWLHQLGDGVDELAAGAESKSLEDAARPLAVVAKPPEAIFRSGAQPDI